MTIYTAIQDKLDNWLDQHGGRTRQDMGVDKNGLFIVMYNGRNKIYDKVYIPKYVQS